MSDGEFQLEGDHEFSTIEMKAFPTEDYMDILIIKQDQAAQICNVDEHDFCNVHFLKEE